MSLESIKSLLPEYAKDLKLNLGTVLTPEGAPGLTQIQIYAIALTASIAARNRAFSDAVGAIVAPHLDDATIRAAKSAAAIMAMNNVYYRATHLLSNREYANMPAKLRMNIIGAPGIEKVDFELFSLAASAVNGCGMCLDAHERVVVKAGVTTEGVHSVLRIASVMHAVATTLEYEQVSLQQAA